MIDVKKILSLLACCMCLAAAKTSWADYVGVVSEFKTDAATADLCGEELGLTVCNVSIQFGDDKDRLLSVAWADVRVLGAPGALFNQHVFGTNVPYSCALLTPFPDLICDSYVAIGEKCAGVGATTPCSDFNINPDDPHSPLDWFNDGGRLFGGWFNSWPANGLGDAFGDTNPDGKVLILQLAVAQGLAVEGTFDVFWQEIDIPEVYQEVSLYIFCAADCDDCPTDVNGDGGTGPFDLAALLAAWGPLEAGNCLDANDDGNIGPFDLANLLAAWGPCQ